MMATVLAVCHQFPPQHETGTEILCLTIMQALQRRGHVVSVVTADAARLRGLSPRIDIVDGVTVTRVPTRHLLPRDRVWELQSELADSAVQRELLSIVAAQQPDVLHAFHSFEFGMSSLAVLARRLPLIMTVTDYAPVCPFATLMLSDGQTCVGPTPDRRNCIAHLNSTGNWTGRIRRLLNRKDGEDVTERLVERRQGAAADLFRHALSIMVASESMRDVFAASGLSTDRVEILPHQAPPTFVPDSDVGSPLRIGFLGTLRPHKGAHILLEAVRRLPHDLPCTVTVRGDLSADPDYVMGLRRLAGSDARVAIVDRLPHCRFGEALGTLDVVVVPSLWPENLPLVLLSAVEHGRFVVVSDAPGLVPALHGNDGVVVPNADPPALAAALESLVRDPAPVRAARRRAGPTGSFEAYVTAIEKIYNREQAGDGMRVT